MTIIAELAKKYTSIKVRLQLMAQAAAGIDEFDGADKEKRQCSFLYYSNEIYAMLDVLSDAHLITFDDALKAKTDLFDYVDRNYDWISAHKSRKKIAEVRGRE